MIYLPELLDQLEELVLSPWEALVYRHMFGDYHPSRANSGGARWNPPGVEAIYASCERETALAEAAHQIAVQGLRPRAKRTLYHVQVRLKTVVDLRSSQVLERLGVSHDLLRSSDHSASQKVGRAVDWLGYEGILVPSARNEHGANLVIYPTRQDVDSEFEVVHQEDVVDAAPS